MKTQDLVSLHGKLAERIKQFETTLDIYPPTEVSNELRYALRAVVEILELNTSNAQADDMEHAVQKAYHALICAYHDLVDGLAIHITITLDELRDKYLEESIVVLGAKRREIIEFLNEVNEKIALSRKNPKERKKIYDEELYDKYFETLLGYRKLLTGKVIEDVVNLHLNNEEKRKQERLKYIFATAIGLLGLAIGLASFV